MNKIPSTALLVLLLSISGFSALADEFQIIPSIAVRQEHNSNIFYTYDDVEDDQITTVIPGLELRERTERLDLNLKGRIAPFFYWDNDDLNDIDQDYRGRIGYQLTERFDVKADGAFGVDHRPDRDVATTGLVQSADRRDRYHFGLGGGYNLTETTATSLSYAYDRDNWDSDSDREDFTGHSINLGFAHHLGRWLETSTGRLNFGYDDYHYESSDIKSFSGTVGIQSQLSEIFKLQVDVGARYVDSDFDTIQFEFVPPNLLVPQVVGETNSGWGGIGIASLKYLGERTNSGLTISHDLRPGGGQQGPSVLTRVIFDVNYLLLEKLSLGLSSSFFRNKADADDLSAFEIDEYTYNVRPRFRWEFYKSFTLEGAYAYSYVDNRVINDHKDQHRVYLQIAYGYPLFELIDFFSQYGGTASAGTYPWPEPR